MTYIIIIIIILLIILIIDHLSSSGSPFTFSHSRVDYSQPSPLFGQHTMQILQELGYDSDEMASLKASGAVL